MVQMVRISAVTCLKTVPILDHEHTELEQALERTLAGLEVGVPLEEDLLALVVVLDGLNGAFV
jgi:hypothetical protein